MSEKTLALVAALAAFGCDDSKRRLQQAQMAADATSLQAAQAAQRATEEEGKEEDELETRNQALIADLDAKREAAVKGLRESAAALDREATELTDKESKLSAKSKAKAKAEGARADYVRARRVVTDDLDAFGTATEVTMQKAVEKTKADIALAQAALDELGDAVGK